MILRDAVATDAYKFAYFSIPGAPPWAKEVEAWARRAWGWYRHPDVEDPRVLIGHNDDGICAIVGHHYAEPNVRYLMVVLLHEDARGTGVGWDLWNSAVDAATLDGTCNVYWRVHEENAGALHLSRKKTKRESEPSGSYITFVFDPTEPLPES